MYSPDAMLETRQQEKQHNDNDLSNVVLTILQEQFIKYNWEINMCRPLHIVYKKPDNDYIFFEWNQENTNNIYVSVPIINSNYQYVTQFKDYFSACEYIKNRLYDYENISKDCDA
jgi:hypothetical protein